MKPERLNIILYYFACLYEILSINLFIKICKQDGSCFLQKLSIIFQLEFFDFFPKSTDIYLCSFILYTFDLYKCLFSLAYSAPGFPAQPPPPFPSEPPPPYAPPSYETAAASSSVAPQMAPYPLNSTCTNVPADGTVPSTSSISQSAAAVHPGNAAVVHPATATDTLPTVS